MHVPVSMMTKRRLKNYCRSALCCIYDFSAICTQRQYARRVPLYSVLWLHRWLHMVVD